MPPVEQSHLTYPDSRLRDFIRIYEDGIDHDTCDLIINEYKPDDLHAVESTVQTSSGEIEKKNTSRNSIEIGLSHEKVIRQNPALRTEIDNRVFESCTRAYGEYVQEVAPWIQANKDEGYSLLIYGPGCFFTEHKDALTRPDITHGEWVHVENSKPRQLSISIQLNEDYEGGDLAFFNGTYVIPKKKGLLTIFPSYALFPHQVTPVKSGTRYSIVTWFS